MHNVLNFSVVYISKSLNHFLVEWRNHQKTLSELEKGPSV